MAAHNVDHIIGGSSINNHMGAGAAAAAANTANGGGGGANPNTAQAQAGGGGGQLHGTPFPTRLRRSVQRQWQIWLDASVPHINTRWAALAAFMVLYLIRVWLLRGFYIITYGLGIFLLNLFIGFLTPLDDVETPAGGDGPALPTASSDEFKPFIRKLPEFKFWYSCARALTLGFCMTFFSVFDVPVFWPILLIYFIVLFVLTMKRQIKHMIKYKYIPFSRGKMKYDKGSDIRAK